jgi:FdhD protein
MVELNTSGVRPLAVGRRAGDDGAVPHSTTRRRVVRIALDDDGTAHARAARSDTLAVEEPLEIRLGVAGAEPEPFTVTMRTPGHDVDLALGFLVAEGVVRSPADVLAARHCPDAARDGDGRATYNVVEVVLAAGVAAPGATRHRHVSSACGICGTETIEAVRSTSAVDVGADDVRLAPAVLAGLPARLRAAQRVFEATGGLHAAGLFTPAGDLVCLREDVGRHNAVDKVVGWSLANGRLPLSGHVLQVSGRASFELVQKAWMAGCAVLAAVSAPSSLAVALAEEAGMTLVGFSRGTGFNVYTGAHRLGL